MTKNNAPIPLYNRSIITLSGSDRKKFLQGLITNNIEKITDHSAIYTALLTPQGKYLYDFFISERDETLYLDCEKSRVSDIIRRLMMYKLRADVTIEDHTSDHTVYVILSQNYNFSGHENYYPDPRYAPMGYRLIKPSPCDSSMPSGDNQYDLHRLQNGLPDGERDFGIDKTFILEGNLEILNGVDFTKGCYIGQEVTARMKHRMNLKKRLLPLKLDGELPPIGTDITNDEGKKIGEIRSGHGKLAIGLLRLENMEFGKIYHCGEVHVTPWRPEWYPN
ncbi:MAG: hypothetical protein K9G26_08880 [Emcibacter sp.]|nr:hypothetical protein [Emcibacter sp.]